MMHRVYANVFSLDILRIIMFAQRDMLEISGNGELVNKAARLGIPPFNQPPHLRPPNLA